MKKLTKFGRSFLSVILCLTMLLTTFCFFDIGSVISEAMVTVTENNKMTGALSSQFMYAPEIVYLTPGSDTFKYFSNYDPASGKALSSNDSTSRLEFEYKGATEVAVAVNKVYYKNGDVDTDFKGTLKINGTEIKTYAAVGSNENTWTTSLTPIASGTNSINLTLNASNCSLSGTTRGTTYYIQWVFRYKVDNNYHVSYMYTGVYVPLLDQAGISSDQRYIASGNNPTENHAWSFITGAMRYSGGNRKSLFTGTTANQLRCAPLISFVGSSQNSSAYTIPGGDGNSMSEINFSSSASPYNTFVYSRGSRGENELYYTTTYTTIPSSYAEDAKGSVSLTNTDMSGYSGITTGTAYIVVDTSRYSNYNQIPFLSAGYAQFYHDQDGNGNKLNSIKSVQRYNPGSTTAISYDGTIYCNVDSSNWTNGDSSSVARGLYSFNGSIVSGLVTFDTWFFNGFKHVIGYTENLGVHHYNGLFTQTVNKQTLRTVYNDAAHTHIDNKTYSSGYSSYYSELKSVAETLCDPQLYSKTTTTLSGTGTGSVKAIETSIVESTTTTNDYVYFYVPEVIYLKPNSTSFEYYSGMSDVSVSDGICSYSMNQTESTGKIFFYYKNASKVKITQSGASSITLGGNITATNKYVDTSTSEVTKAQITSGSVSSNTSTYINWTATYVEDNIEKTITAKTYVYSTRIGTSSLIAATAHAKQWWTFHTNSSISVTSWIAGAHSSDYYAASPSSFSGTTNGNEGDGRGSYKGRVFESTTVPTTSETSVDGLFETGNGASGYWSSDSDVDYTGGAGWIHVDTSRFTNLNQIPNLQIGLDNNYELNGKEDQVYLSYRLGTGSYTSTETKKNTTPGTRIFSGIKLNISISGTGNSYVEVYGYGVKKAEDDVESKARAYLYVDKQNRSGLRQAVEYATKYSYALQAGYFNGSTEWTAYTTALANAQNALTKVDGTADFGTYNTDSSKRSGLAKTLMDAVDTLVSKSRGTAPRNTSDYTATQTNVGLIAQSDGSYKVAAIAEAVTDGTATIAKSFKAYDKLEFSAESYSGYDYVGYCKDGASSNGSVISATAYNAIQSSTDVVQQSKNDSLIFGNALNTAYSYTFYYLLKPDVLFDNEFDFDNYNFRDATVSGATILKDCVENSISFTSKTTDDYTNGQDSGTPEGMNCMTLISSHTYRVSYNYSTDKAALLNFYLFANTSKTYFDWGRLGLKNDGTGDFYNFASKTSGAESGTTTGTFTIPDGKPYVTIRVGTTTSGVNVKFSDIYIQDITNLDGFTDDVGEATPRGYYNLTAGEKLGSVAGIERTGYAFDGWYDSQDSTGNGTGTQYTADSAVKPYNVRLFAKWVLAPELMFGNEFVFDNIDKNTTANNASMKIDYASNVLSLTCTSDATDEYYQQEGRTFSGLWTNTWYGMLSAAFPVTAGHTYRVSVIYTNKSAEARSAEVYIFGLESASATGPINNSRNEEETSSAKSGESKYISFEYTPPSTAKYAALRFGLDDNATKNDVAQFSQIYVQDLTNPAGNCNDGVTTANPINKVKLAGQTVGTLADIERYGYDFVGWYTDRDSSGNGTGTQYTESTTMPDSNTQLWAKWAVKSYTITYNANGGTVSPSSNKFTINDDVPLPTPTKTGYTFTGWKVTETDENSETPEGSTVTVQDNSNWVVDTTYSAGTSKVDKGMYGNVTVEAQWTVDSFTLSYNGNKPADAPESVTGVPDNQTLTYDSSSTINSTAPKLTGYTFKGWKASTTNVSNIWLAGATITAAQVNGMYTDCGGKGKTYTVYAQWDIDTYTVTFNADGGSVDPTSKNYTITDSISLPTPTKTGYTFTGWKVTTANGNWTKDTVYTGSSIAKGKYGNVTLTAQWKPIEYTITYVYNNGSSNTTANYTIETSITLPSPSKTGYTFAGWKVTTADGSWKLTDSVYSGTVAKGKYGNPTLTAQWTKIEYKITFAPDGGSVDPTSASYTIETTTVTLPLPTKSGYTFAGWLVTTGEGSWTEKVNKTLYNSGSLTVTGMYGNATLTAQWIYTQTADNKTTEYGTENNSIEIVLGVNADGSDKKTTTTKYDETGWKNYQSAIEAYKNALSTFNNDVTNTTNKSKLEAAIKTLTDITLNVRKVDKSYIDAFYIKNDTTNTYSVKNINLNHYITSTLSTIEEAYTKATGVNAAELITSTAQTTINNCVRTLAQQYVNKGEVTTTPTYKVYENGDKIKAALESSEDIDGVSYVRTVENSSIYYCYTNKTNPKVYLTVEDSEDSSNRICYPTRSTINSNEVVNSILGKLDGTVTNGYTVSSKAITNSVYASYIESGLGSTYTGTVNGESFTGEDYYNRQSTITLSPTFTGSTNAAVQYVITSTDDSYNKDDATMGANYAETASLSAGKKDKNFETSDVSKTITIVIDYHKGDQLNVTSDQVDADKYLKQFHLFRTSGGARNWELPYSGDETYTVNDGTYGQTDRGSFTFTYELGATDIGSGKINTTDVNEIVKLFKTEANYNAAKSMTFVGAKYWVKEENGTYTEKYGSGLGYQVWGNNWSFNYYPKTKSYTYVHLVDRWGNTVDKVFYVGEQDIKEVTVSTTSTNGVYTVLEDGGSGIDTLSLNATSMEILTDESSTLENNVYKTTGNTVKIQTGEANKSYTLTMKDKATNASTATLTSDENGIITLNVTDEAYTSGVYTFMLNDIEINLYDAVNNDKYIVKVNNGEAEEGDYAELSVVTTGEVGKVRFTDTDGNTITIASCEKNTDGTKTWKMSKKRAAGEYKYSISVKVGYNWIEESSKGTLTFTAKILDSGVIRSAEYDAETGLYKITIEGRATKIQFITEDGMTRTYTRYNEFVKSKKTYDAEGNEVNDTARTLDHEIWLVDAKLYSGLKYTVAGKFEAGWNMNGTATMTAH